MDTEEMGKTTEVEKDAKPDQPVDEARRNALAKLALWTPPAMLTLLLSERAQAFSPPPPP